MGLLESRKRLLLLRSLQKLEEVAGEEDEWSTPSPVRADAPTYRAPPARLIAGSRRGPPRRSAPDEWMPLFNGRDLSGWDTFLGKPQATTDVPGVARQPDGTYAEVVGSIAIHVGSFRWSRR